MKDFDIAKYLREHQMGSYGILNHYVDIKPLKEEAEVGVKEFNSYIRKNYPHIYHNLSDKEVQEFLNQRHIKSLPIQKQADFFADYIVSQGLGDVVAEDTAPAKGEYVVYFKTREMDKPKEYKRVKDKWEAETAASIGYEFYKDDYLDYQWGYWPAEKWDAWVSKTVSEDVTPEETAEIPYLGSEPKLDGFGDEFKQADTVSEEENDMPPLVALSKAAYAAKEAGISMDQAIRVIKIEYLDSPKIEDFD